MRDIEPGADSASPRGFASLGGTLYLSALTSASGVELWQTDGTPAGTRLVQDIFPGTASSAVEHLAASGGRLFFAGDDSSGCSQLWSSDGTPTGAARVATIHSGTDSSSPHGYYDDDGLLWFGADDGVAGRELWITDGSATTRLADVCPGACSSGAPRAAPRLGRRPVQRGRRSRTRPRAVLPLASPRDTYRAIVSGNIDPERGVLDDTGRPLVFYGLDAPAAVLR